MKYKIEIMNQSFAIGFNLLKTINAI